MAIQVQCNNPRCRKSLRLRDELAGRHVRCPGCGDTLAAPAVAAPVAAVPVEAVPVVPVAPVPVEPVLEPVAGSEPAKPGGGVLFALVAAAGLAGFVLLAGTGVLFLTGAGDTAETAQNNPPSPDPLPHPQPRQDDAPRDEVVDALESRVESGSVEEQIKAAREAGALGERARPMAESLCELAARSTGQARTAALDALEKVHPALYLHVRTLLTVGEPYARRGALVKLREMGREGRAAVPAVRALLGEEPMVADSLNALAVLGPDDPRVLAELIARLKDPRVKDQWRRSEVVAAAAAGLGRVAEAEPAFRKDVVAALIPLLDGPDKLQAVRALAGCGKEAVAAEKKLAGEVRYDSSPEVQKAVDATLVEIAGHKKADALVGPAAARGDLAALGRLAGDGESKWVRQQARERLRLVHPDLERLALILFEAKPGEELPGLDTLRPVGKGGGAAIPPMVEVFALRAPPSAYGSPPRPSVLDVYATMVRLAPDSPEVRRFLMNTARAYADRVRTPAAFAAPAALPDVWTGRMLIESGDGDPEVKGLLIELALQVADSEAGREVPGGVVKEQGARLGWVVGDLGELARRRPEWRAEIADALVKVMEKRTPDPNSGGGQVDHDVLAQALRSCGGEAYVRLRNHPALEGSWRERFVALVDQLEKEGMTRAGGSPGAVAPVASSGEKGHVPPPAPPPGSKRPAHARLFRDRFYSVEGHTYWDNAKSRAESLGARLAVIPDKETNDFLTGLLDETGHGTAYIGARLRKEGWVWVDGSPVRFRSWSTKLRSINDQYRPYAYLLDDGTWGTSFDNRSNYNRPVARPAVYEWELEKDAKPWAAAPSPPPPGGSHRPADTVAFRGKHYRYVAEKLSWHQAKLRCEELGGRLAVVPDQEMNDFLMMLLADAPAEAAWIGMTSEKGAWAWADGSAAGFRNFEGNPGVGGERAYAALRVESGGKWSVLANRPDGSSGTPGFLCEWDQ